MLKDGLYEQLINNSLREEISSCDPEKIDIRTSNFDGEDSPEILSRYVASVLKDHLSRIGESNKSEKEVQIQRQLEATNRILSAIQASSESLLPLEGKQLHSVFHRENSILAIEKKASIVRPETSLVDSSLFTGAEKEPQMFSELKKEILSCNRIRLLVSFIKWSGIRLILDELRAFTQNGGVLFIATTSYMGATDLKAIVELSRLQNTKIKISYDTTRTRLHAKAYIFERDTGFTTAYIGSSNISNAALSSGLEWNLKIAQKSLPNVFRKIIANFESYWNAKEFELYTESDYNRLKAELSYGKGSSSAPTFSFDIHPFPYQQEILDNLQTERKIHGRYRNLVVAATGTGKTVVSALDYRNFQKENPQSPAKLLFVAHREEILEQSLCTFRAVLKDPNFGELLVGNHEASDLKHLFVSIQTFNSKDFTGKTSSDFYDYIVIDEFHHAAAPTYRKLLGHYKPKILLGLTATPERMDGKDILDYFDGKVAAEIRLPEAIDRKLLCPFQYFGVTDSIDLGTLKWTRGGYDRSELSNVYTLDSLAAKRRASLVAESVIKYVSDIGQVKGLGFCVSVRHAEFMRDEFNAMGIPSMALSGKSDDSERSAARNRLVSGEVRFIFVVDIYNEGVDIPEVNTVLFLRPTESLTVFLQQLGRGLRLSEGKDCLTVLDFIGQANKKYNFEDKFQALLSHQHRNISREIEKGFTSAPKGCYIQLEKKATEYILENIRSAFGNQNAFVQKIRSFEEDSGLSLSLSSFLNHYHLDPRRLYRKNSFSRLCVNAGVRANFEEPDEKTFTAAFKRFAQIDSRRFIRFILDILERGLSESLTEEERRMAQMFRYTFWGETNRFESAEASIAAILRNKVLCKELSELLKFNYERIDFIDAPIGLNFACPLDLYCSYSRDQILVACDFLKTSSMREGVKYLAEKNLDLLFVTLDKSEKDYSETTLYNDYSISENLFHWQSQSTTSESSETGKRYIDGHRFGNQVVLFVRESKKDAETGMTPPYTCLGKVKCVAHEGSSPIDITWKLEHPIPARFLRATNKMMVG